MEDPGAYFSDPKETELAKMVWALAAQRMKRGELKSMIHRPLVYQPVPDLNQLVYASDWITVTRGDGEEAGTEDVNRELGKPSGYFNATQIADVEHFYRAAFLSTWMGPTIATSASAGWELVVDGAVKTPILNGLTAANNAADGEEMKAFFRALPAGFMYGVRRFPDNAAQFFGPDLAGVTFGSKLNPTSIDPANGAAAGLGEVLKAAKQLMSTPPPAKPPPDSPAKVAPPPPLVPGVADEIVPVIPRKTTLSGVSKDKYGTFDLWPLIWDLNRSAVGDNPNRLQGVKELRVRRLRAYSATQIEDARKRAPTWKNFPL